MVFKNLIFGHVTSDLNQPADFLTNIALSRRSSHTLGELGVTLEAYGKAPYNPWVQDSVNLVAATRIRVAGRDLWEASCKIC